MLSFRLSSFELLQLLRHSAFHVHSQTTRRGRAEGNDLLISERWIEPLSGFGQELLIYHVAEGMVNTDLVLV